jgi:hypothetical protein
MRVVVAVWLGVVGIVALSPEAVSRGKEDVRYGFAPNLDRYPQKTPQKALESVLDVVRDRNIGYLLAHLADPQYVDGRVAKLEALIDAKVSPAGRKLLAFERLTKETTENFLEDPAAVNELRRFLKDGEWEVGDKAASAKVKNLPGRAVFLRKIQDRWYLENRQK